MKWSLLLLCQRRVFSKVIAVVVFQGMIFWYTSENIFPMVCIVLLKNHLICEPLVVIRASSGAPWGIKPRTPKNFQWNLKLHNFTHFRFHSRDQVKTKQSVIRASSDAPWGVKPRNSAYYLGLVNNHQFKIDGKLSCSFPNTAWEGNTQCHDWDTREPSILSFPSNFVLQRFKKIKIVCLFVSGF